MNFIKKSIAIIALLSPCILELSAQEVEHIEPQITARIESPREFSSKILRIIRAAKAGPESEMQFSMGLAPFGYPKFDGIDPKKGIVFCAFFDNTNVPYIGLACKATEESALASNTKSMQMKSVRDGDFFMLELLNSTPENAKLINYVQPMKAALEKDYVDAAQIKISGDFATNLIKVYSEAQTLESAKTPSEIINLFGETKNISIAFNEDEETLRLRVGIEARNGTKLSEAIKCAQNKSPVREMKFIDKSAKNYSILSMSPKSLELFGELFAPFIKMEGLSASDINIIGRLGKGTSASSLNFENGSMCSLSVFATDKSDEEIFSTFESYYKGIESPMLKATTKRVKLSDIPAFKKYLDENPKYADKQILTCQTNIDNPLFNVPNFMILTENGFCGIANNAEYATSFIDKANAPDVEEKLAYAAMAKITISSFVTEALSKIGIDTNALSEPIYCKFSTDKDTANIEIEIPFRYLENYTNMVKNIKARQNSKAENAHMLKPIKDPAQAK